MRHWLVDAFMLGWEFARARQDRDILELFLSECVWQGELEVTE